MNRDDRNVGRAARAAAPNRGEKSEGQCPVDSGPTAINGTKPAALRHQTGAGTSADDCRFRVGKVRRLLPALCTPLGRAWTIWLKQDGRRPRRLRISYKNSVREQQVWISSRRSQAIHRPDEVQSPECSTLPK